MYPVQCLTAPCTYQGPNLPFQWFSHSSWRWCSSHDNKLLGIFLISLALLILWLQVPSFLPEDRLASISPFPNSLAIKITFFKTQFKSIFLFPKRKDLWWECGTPPPFLGLIWPEFEVGANSFLSDSLLHCPSCWRFCPNLYFLKIRVRRALYTFLLAHNLPLQPTIRMTYICFTTLLDHKLLEKKD